ncbi:KTSC domain-containing protein [Paraburkholderia caribensis]|uniref:KTSC domain-containing protein n=1 Tax=Paraburkholderia caribensis TaxID=75105 RepID=UPI001CAFB416|nr:KTSC domain-containing protein [Paraburkholderia caribensis]CAG9255872.1 KTSC domain-containing protein [Paraburkholderia caribensis]
MNAVIPAIEMLDVESSQIHSIGHDASSNTLAVRFKSRVDGKPTSLYHYSNVPAEEFTAFRDAASIGSYFYKHIKPHDTTYPYVCIEKMPAPAPSEEGDAQ